MKISIKSTLLFLLTFLLISGTAYSQSEVEVNAGGDLVSRYVWRGLDFGNSPAIQPSLSVGYAGLAIGAWGSYTFNETASVSDELDLWIGYTLDTKPLSVSVVVTDYYFPNNGLKFGNFNDYDDEEGPGAHVFEGMLSIAFNDFPLVISGAYNFYNDAGNNTYFQISSPFSAKGYDFEVFCGATAGSEENPAYYGADNFSVINLGIKAVKEIKISDSFDLPVFVSYSLNPKLEQSYMVFGISF